MSGSTRGIILMNTGSPDSPEPDDVRRFLAEFLMDPNVIDIPWIFRSLLVKGIILPRRPKLSSHAYKQIWQPEGSPLILYTKSLVDQLKTRTGLLVEIAMAYGNPGYKAAVDSLLAAGVDDILLIPLFPHFAQATFGSCAEAVETYFKSLKTAATLRTCPPFYNRPDYIDALCETLTPTVEAGDSHILFSFHGLPERQLKKSDPTGHHCLSSPDCCNIDSPAHKTCYRAQCLKTATAIIEKTGLSTDRYDIAFQSRLGRGHWLQPYTSDILEVLPKRGIKKLSVICPSFVCDCLETLEEIGIRAKEEFLAAGGEELILIPCLNTNAKWLNTLQGLIEAT